MKKCFKCQRELPLSEFYKHKQMEDGHLNKCKGCTKKDSTNHRNNNIERIREYDRKRGSRQSPEYQREYRKKYPNKDRSHKTVRKAIFKDELFPEPCEICGKPQTHAHHDDYLKPLNVRWLCAACHKQWHTKNGGAANP